MVYSLLYLQETEEDLININLHMLQQNMDKLVLQLMPIYVPTRNELKEKQLPELAEKDGTSIVEALKTNIMVING